MYLIYECDRHTEPYVHTRGPSGPKNRSKRKLKSVNSYQIGTHNLWLKFYLDCEDQTILVKLGTNSSDVLLEISKILDTQPYTICQWLWLQCHSLYRCLLCLSYFDNKNIMEGSANEVWRLTLLFCVWPWPGVRVSLLFRFEFCYTIVHGICEWVSPSFMPFSLFCSTRKPLRYSGFR